MSAWKGSAWEAVQELAREQQAKRWRSGCGHPGCPIEDEPAKGEPVACSLAQPLMLHVPPGGHAHITCSAHPGGHVVFGTKVSL